MSSWGLSEPYVPYIYAKYVPVINYTNFGGEIPSILKLLPAYSVMGSLYIFPYNDKLMKDSLTLIVSNHGRIVFTTLSPNSDFYSLSTTLNYDSTALPKIIETSNKLIPARCCGGCRCDRQPTASMLPKTVLFMASQRLLPS